MSHHRAYCPRCQVPKVYRSISAGTVARCEACGQKYTLTYPLMPFTLVLAVAVAAVGALAVLIVLAAW